AAETARMMTGWPHPPGAANPLPSHDIRRRDLDAEAFEADIVAFARRDQPDRGDAEILENLRAEPDFQPFAFALLRLVMVFLVMLAGAGGLRYADADRALA